MNEKLESINLFKGYAQDENAKTHAFLSFLYILLRSNETAFLFFWKELNLLSRNIRPKATCIGCLKQNFATWDGQIFSEQDKWFIAIESKINKGALNSGQLKRHLAGIKRVKKEYEKVKLVLLTPFDKDWICQEYLNGKNQSDIDFLSWGDIYKAAVCLLKKNLKSPPLKIIVEEYISYLNDANFAKAGIIQMVNEDIFYSENRYEKIKNSEDNKFHIPNKIVGFDFPSFRVFLYGKDRGGLFASFTSEGMWLDSNRRKDEEFKYYFKISNFKDLKNSPISAVDIRKLLWSRDKNNHFRHFKENNCPAPYYFLNRDMVNKLEQVAKRRS